jgi:dihydrofolate synthase/folylpolyglutamate synthase
VTFEEAVRWLYSTQLFGIKLGLENMERLWTAVESALETSGTEPPCFIHVAGTNGKGSVCAMLDSILRAAEIRTALYTSPHLVTFRERARIDGEMISEQEVAAGLTRIRGLIAGWEPPPTFFEITTALALGWFRERRARAIVLETGLGGRLDATNIVSPAVSILTEIAHDHEKYLGSTLTEIAHEKAGIIKPGVPVVSAPQTDEVCEVIERTAEKAGSALQFVERPWMEGAVGLAGTHQKWNAALAMLALRTGGRRSALLAAAAPRAKAGLERVQWPGRFQRADERFVLDGAHNPAAAKQLAATWRESFGAAKATLILGVMRDKDVRGVCAALAPIAARVFTVTVQNPRSTSAPELAAVMRRVTPEVEVREFGTLSDALAEAPPHAELGLVAGSLFLVGEALVALGLSNNALEKSVQ